MSTVFATHDMKFIVKPKFIFYKLTKTFYSVVSVTEGNIQCINTFAVPEVPINNKNSSYNILIIIKFNNLFHFYIIISTIACSFEWRKKLDKVNININEIAFKK